MGKLRSVPFKVGDAVEARLRLFPGRMGSWSPGFVTGLMSASDGRSAVQVRIGNALYVVDPKDVRHARAKTSKTPARGPRSTTSKLRPRGPKADRGGPVRDEKYLAFVRTKPCMFCRAPAPSEASHVGLRGLGQKTDDLRCTPKCHECHRLWGEARYGLLLERAGSPDAIAAFPTVEQRKGRVLALIHERQVDLLVEYFGRAA